MNKIKKTYYKILFRIKRRGPESARVVVDFDTEKSLYIPSGTCIKTPAGYFYVKGIVIHPINSKRVLNSWGFPRIVHMYHPNLSGLVIGSPLGFRDGTLIMDISDMSIYFIADGKKRKILDPDVLYNLGFKQSDALLVSESEAAMHKTGGVIV